MNKIALLYRKKSGDRHSIEGLFEPLEELNDVDSIKLPHDLSSFKNAIKLLFFALKIKQRNIHITGDVHYMAIILFWKNIIITVHDCNHYEDLTGIRKYVIGLLWFKLPILISKKIIVISPFAKTQLQSNFKVKDCKIKIIPNTFNPIRKKNNLKQTNDFSILTIGTKANKNLKQLIKAVKGLNGVKLHIVGEFDKSQKKLLNQYSIKYLNFFDLNRTRLEEIFNSSDMLFFASTKEGFGLPILEAQSCGLPVLTSNTTAMPYVAGEGALIVDPNNTKEINAAILKLINDGNLRQQLIKKGYANIKRFSKSQFISNYKKVYKTLL